MLLVFGFWICGLRFWNAKTARWPRVTFGQFANGLVDLQRDEICAPTERPADKWKDVIK